MPVNIEKDERVCPNTNCQYDHNVKGANFCVLCGTLLYHRCENCVEVNPQYSRFCYYCGSSLSEVKPSVPYEAEDDFDIIKQKR